MTVTSLTLNSGDSPPDELYCGTSSTSAAANVALITGTGLDNSTFTLSVPADPSFVLGPPVGVSVGGSGTTLQGNFTAYQTSASPGPVQIQVTIADTLSHKPKYKGILPTSFNNVVV